MRVKAHSSFVIWRKQMSFKQANKIRRLESANKRLIKQNISLIDENEKLRTRLDKTENRIKDGSEQINEMIKS